MANPVLGKSLCFDWFFLCQEFAVSMETVQPVYFCFGAKPANLQPKQQEKTVKSAIRIISNLQTELAEAILGNIGPRARLEVKYKNGVLVLEQKQKE